MTDEIRVTLVRRDGYLYLRYLDPVSGKYAEKSTKTTNRSIAAKAAGVWENELRNGRYQKPSHMTWEAFRDHFSTNVLPGLAKGTRITYEATLNVFERVCNPQRLSQVTTARITAFTTKLREDGLREATIARHLRGMKVAMRWANREGLLLTVPKFTMPKRAKGAKTMRGRAVTTEEFERMLSVIPKVVANAAAESWKFYLRGLWTSGLRLSESLTLQWDDSPEAIVVDLLGRRPMFRVPSEAEKGNQDRLLPMTPDFAALLESVPKHERQGRVFKLLGIDGEPLDTTRFAVGPLVSEIGRTAGVIVDERKKRVQAASGTPAHDVTVRKFASAHDLRRAFGFRWAMRVMPTVLKEIMRHEDIGTTMKYYVGQNAEAIADALWSAAGECFGESSSVSKTSK
jgi:integrase